MNKDELYFYNRGFNDCLAKGLNPIKEQDESFDRTASHMAGEYVSYTKDLTDEEILSLTGFKENPYDIFIEYEKEDLIEFARAILRKAK